MPMTKFNIVVTNLEHDTNVSPFVRMAEDLQVGSNKNCSKLVFQIEDIWIKDWWFWDNVFFLKFIGYHGSSQNKHKYKRLYSTTSGHKQGCKCLNTSKVSFVIN